MCFVGCIGYVYDSQADYDGVHVVSQSGHSLVFVNFNYRVGLFGFLASEKVRQNGDLNAGLLDQRRLLLWVKQNIAQVRLTRSRLRTATS
jgi:carboxylesterase type B